MFQSSTLFEWSHVHPVLVHFTTALLPASLASDLVGKYANRDSLTHAAWWMLLYGAVATPLTALAGWMWSTDILSNSTLSVHKWLGLILVLAFLILAVWRGRIFVHSGRPGTLYLLFAASVVAVLMYQGFLGGKMTLG
ncbi:MAG TPA: DUF2231 domain-containing protein [Pyrinomonadaceae bacterium]|jgi:uncharacterized membrane protein